MELLVRLLSRTRTSSTFCRVRNRCSSSVSSSTSSILAYLDGGVTNSTPVTAGVEDSVVGYPGVVGEPAGDDSLPSPGVGEVGPGEGGESGPGPALPSPGVGCGSNTMCSTVKESAPNVFTGESGELQSQRAFSSNTTSRVIATRPVAGSYAR